MLATINDKKLATDDGNGEVAYYEADVVTANDYYPFGMIMPGRKYAFDDSYRYGFNGKENDNEVKGEGSQQDYGMRIYDPRLGRFLSVDPITANYPELTPYQFASNTPIQAVDLDGAESMLGWSIGLTPEQAAEAADSWNKQNVKIVNGTASGIKKSLTSTWNFITSDAWKAQTWKNAWNSFGNLSDITFGNFDGRNDQQAYNTIQPYIDNFKEKVINGDAFTRSEYFAEFGTDLFTGYVGSKGVGAIKDLALGKKAAFGLGSLRKPAITPGIGESALIDYSGGLASRKFSEFTNVIKGNAGDAATKYLWTIDNRGINIALEQTPAATQRGFITHTNISSAASAGGEVWFTGEKSVFINAKSARFGGASMTAEQWNSAKTAWEKIGYKVEAADFKPPTQQ